MGRELEAFCRKLSLSIDDADRRIYLDSGLGWRFLYAPKATLENARCALIGLNPGGTERDRDRDGFSVENGSAYCIEDWNACHRSRARKIIAAMGFGQREHEVLSGNLVPFRSEDWRALCHKDQALHFGLRIWSLVFAYCASRLNLVVAHGDLPRFATMHLLNVRIASSSSDKEILEGEFGDGCRFVGIPHLSRRQGFDIGKIVECVESNAKRARMFHRLG